MNKVHTNITVYNFQTLGSRGAQEDSIYINEHRNVYLVCDGIGGINDGDLASTLIVKFIEEKLEDYPIIKSKKTLEDLINSAFNAFEKYGLENKIDHQMGTTLVLLLLVEDTALIAHIGDSRAFYFSESNDDWISKDHSLVQELFDAGILKTEAEMQSHPLKNKITNALMLNSGETELKIEINEVHHISKGDMFILCSDGAIENMSNSDVKDLFDNKSITLASRWELFKSNARLSSDNSSAILIEIEKDK